MARFPLILAFTIISTLLVPDLIPNQNKSDLQQKALIKIDEADRLQNEKDIEPALAAYLQAADLYEQILKLTPQDRDAAQNRQYCLGQRGYIQIIRAQKLAEGKNWASAAALYEGAVTAYELALQKLPQDRGFAGNLRFAREHGSRARFQVILELKGPAPDFTLTTFDNQKLSKKDLVGKVILIEFWTGWCPSCRETLPTLQKLEEAFRGKPFQLIAVALDRVESWKRSGSDQKAIESVKRFKLQAAWGDDGICYRYGAFQSVPTMVLIDARGRLAQVIPYEKRDFDSLRTIISAQL